MFSAGMFDRFSVRKRRGSALLLALVFVALFGTLAVGYLAAANANTKSARLQVESRRAQMAAESGLAFLRRALPALDVHGADTADNMLLEVADRLNATYGATIFGGRLAQVEGDTVLLPALVLNFPEGTAEFRMQFQALSDTQYVVRSTGACNGASRSVYASFVAERDNRILGAYGIASRSRITMTGNPTIEGANNDQEGSVLSATWSTGTPVSLTGNVDISGDVCVTNPNGLVSLVGNIDIGGDILKGVPEPVFPDVDTSVFLPYATNVVGPGTKTSGNLYFENIRILANTNPTFSGNTTIRGIVYIESPNRVTFNGNLNIIGAVVVQPPTGPLDLSNHSLRFLGNCTTNGVAALPAGPQFDGLRELTGSFVLAPGYAVDFTGNFGMINGSILGSRMSFTGNAHGTIRGSILNYADTDFQMAGNAHLTIDHSGLNESPAGMVFPRRLAYVAGTYDE